MSEPTASLVVGDPQQMRATFTRFLLPFAWRAKNSEPPDKGDLCFHEASLTDWIHAPKDGAADKMPHLDMARRRYLTPETDRLLHQRAKWLVLKNGSGCESNERQTWREFDVQSDFGTTYRVALRPPAMVLFEWPDDPKHDGVDDPLRIGFLVHEAFFPKDRNVLGIGDLLRFNEIFRYWRSPFDEFDAFCRNELESFRNGVGGGKGVESEATHEGSADLYAGRWAELLDLPVFVDGKAWRVKWSFDNGVTREQEAPDCFPAWMANPDDRAFTMPFAVLENAPEDTFAPFEMGADTKDPGVGGLWVKLLNVDRIKPWELPSIPSSTAFEKKWARERTYTRWAEGETPTLYGFCQHSFAALSTAAEKGHGDIPLALHFGQMYFDATLLHIHLRVALFRFSARLHKITAEARDKTGQRREFEAWREPFHKLRWQFLQFENLYRFPLFSNQQQHLEMFTLQSKAMDAGELYAEVEKEVRASDEYLENELADERNRMAGTLNVVAAFGLAGALALGWMDAHADTQSGLWYFGALFVVFLLALLSTALFSNRLGKVISWFNRARLWVRLLSFAILVAGLIAGTKFVTDRFERLQHLFQANEVGDPPAPPALDSQAAPQPEAAPAAPEL